MTDNPKTAEVICGICKFPIHRNDTGVRHFGYYNAHSESTCVSLLRGRIAELEAAAVVKGPSPTDTPKAETTVWVNQYREFVTGEVWVECFDTALAADMHAIRIAPHIFLSRTRVVVKEGTFDE